MGAPAAFSMKLVDGRNWREVELPVVFARQILAVKINSVASDKQ